MINLNAESIFKIAERMERQGAEFYRAAARDADDDKRSLLMALAEMEFNHERTFAAMRTAFAGGEVQSVTPPAHSQSALYLQAIGDGGVFDDDSAKALTGADSIDKIFDVAISLEKDSIVFYQSMKSIVPPGRIHQQIDEIIEQEIGHILDLTRN